VFELLELKKPQVKVNPASASVPWMRVKALVLEEPCVNASPSVTVMPAPLTVTGLNVFPALVIVPVPLIVSVPE
jgi:hypothetical protein